MPQPDRLVLDLRRRVLDSAIDRAVDDLVSVDLERTQSTEPDTQLPAWISEQAELRKRPVFDRWQR